MREDKTLEEGIPPLFRVAAVVQVGGGCDLVLHVEAGGYVWEEGILGDPLGEAKSPADRACLA